MSTFNFEMSRTLTNGKWCVEISAAPGIKVQWQDGELVAGQPNKRMYLPTQDVYIRLHDTTAPADEAGSTGWILAFAGDKSAMETHSQWGGPGTFELGR